jgi:UrcA family protein
MVPVSMKGFDLKQPADAVKFHAKLDAAAYIACAHGNRVDLAPLDDPQQCVENALAEAVRKLKSPALTQVYLGTHWIREAAIRGIAVPAQVAAK